MPMAVSGHKRKSDMAFVRVKLVSEAAGWGDYPVVVDLKINDVRRSIGNYPLFGAMGRQNRGEYWPFRMNRDGNIDFGTPGEIRNARMNLLEQEIQVGKICTYREAPNDPDVIYRIKDVAPL